MNPLATFERKLRYRFKTHRLKRQGMSGHQGAAIRVTGGIGDLIVVARFIRDLCEATGETQFSIFFHAPAVAEAVFTGTPGFQAAHPEAYYKYGKQLFGYAITLSQFLHVDKWPDTSSDPTQDSDVAARTVQILERFEEAVIPIEEIRARHPQLDNALGRYACIKGHGRRDFLHFLCGLTYGGDVISIGADQSATTRFGLAPGRYVTIHNGSDENMQSRPGEISTKTYLGWAEVISELMMSCKTDLRFVQIGTPKTSTPIPGVDLDLLGQTSLQEALGLVSQAAFHLDNEGGFVHAAAAFGTKSCVVFGPTSMDYFSYPGNLNLAPGACGDCWWMEKTWMVRCIRGLETPACMASHEPHSVAERLLQWMTEQAPQSTSIKTVGN